MQQLRVNNNGLSLYAHVRRVGVCVDVRVGVWMGGVPACMLMCDVHACECCAQSLLDDHPND